MNKRLALCAILFSASMMQVGAVSHKITKKQMEISERAHVKKLYSSYLASLVLSGCVGATTGTVVRYFEKKLNIESSPIALFLMFFGWALESEFRNDIIAALQKDLDVYLIDHKKGLMFKGAWIASWLAYLQ